MELKLFEQVGIGVFRLMVGGDPFGDFCIFAEDGGVGDGGVAPADAPLIFLGRVLRFMDEDICILEEFDNALVGFDKGTVLSKGIWVAEIA